MRKRIIPSSDHDAPATAQAWLNLETLAAVDVTSEDAAYPIEAALLPGGGAGWRAEGRGAQTIRLLFERPQRLTRIWLQFTETDVARTQEYVLRWSDDGGRTYREVVRQQWNFSPGGATTETEDHQVDLPGVTTLELNIVPDVAGGSAVASLTSLRVA
jgi:hypothetical protein